MVYRCTHVRLVSQPDWQGKPITACESLLMDREVAGLSDKTLPGLIKKLATKYELPLVDNVSMEENERGESVIVYLATVNEDGLEPSQEELREWNQGKIPLFFYKYNWTIEKTKALAITKEELEEVARAG